MHNIIIVGQVGINVDMRWFEPEDATLAEDLEAVEVSYQFANYWFLNPLLHAHGDYPDLVRLKLDIKSAEQHYKRSRLPKFTDEELDRIRGSLDFLGVSFFTTYTARSLVQHVQLAPGNESVPINEWMENDIGAKWLPYEEAFGAFDVKVSCATVSLKMYTFFLSLIIIYTVFVRAAKTRQLNFLPLLFFISHFSMFSFPSLHRIF